MRVIVINCGDYGNESEKTAIEHLKSNLQRQPGDDLWILLCNLSLSINDNFKSSEIDIIAIGPPGVVVIEVKHWKESWFDSNPSKVDKYVDILSGNAKKVATIVKRHYPKANYIDCTFLITENPQFCRNFFGVQKKGVSFFPLNNWKGAIKFDDTRNDQRLSARDVEFISNKLYPNSDIYIDGSLKRFENYIDLKLITPKDQRFQRVYKGRKSSTQDRAVLYLYDLSASSDKNPESVSERPWATVQKLSQKQYSWIPSILDSYQEAPGYAGEMYFFSFIDPAVPSLDERKGDINWTNSSRLDFAQKTVVALSQLHMSSEPGDAIIHRNLTPLTILVKYDNSPIFTGFERTRIPQAQTVAPSQRPTDLPEFNEVAPEIKSQGFSAADFRSDVYSLCMCLRCLFDKEIQSDEEKKAEKLFNKGLDRLPENRITLKELNDSILQLMGQAPPPPPPPHARFWTEGQEILFQNHKYKIINRLGVGSFGITFKVEKVDKDGESGGSYVGKVVHDRARGIQALRSYNLVQSHLGRHGALAAIFAFAPNWDENNFTVLMSWIEGDPFADFKGLFALCVEDSGEESVEALAVRWLIQVCEGLHKLHENNLIHGDVSPKNIINSKNNLVLIDYDCIGKIGAPIDSPGTLSVSPPSFQNGLLAAASDDLYALASSFFYVIFDKDPFQYNNSIDKARGLNWDNIDKNKYPTLVKFFNKATSPDREMRFSGAIDAIESLKIFQQKIPLEVSLNPKETVESFETLDGIPDKTIKIVQTELKENRVDWLYSVLQSYPGSRYGNAETRGLDSKFATETYVETKLEKSLLSDIMAKKVKLVILCGNAGDGKTALLQHLASELGLGSIKSSERILKKTIKGGIQVCMNLDGSADWNGRSAGELLDEFLAPFNDGPPPNRDIVHLLAINDGVLLEWIESVENDNPGGTKLSSELFAHLQGKATIQETYIRFINLNQRSLVGGVTPADSNGVKTIKTEFLDQLIDHLYGGEKAKAIWSPCQSCSAKECCRVYEAARIFGPADVPGAKNDSVRKRSRQRLSELLQAVHLRGEAHITVRELRAAVVYILFGINSCEDYHAKTDSYFLPYWDRAFLDDSPGRQGDVLREAVKFDPALEAHPFIDRYLLSNGIADNPITAPHYPGLKIESARRRAYFEWTPENIKQIANNGDDEVVLDLARGGHLQKFRDLPLFQQEELQKICELLCQGISKLGDLPPQALNRGKVVPLRITPRTPTETNFWVEKSLDNFRLEPVLHPEMGGMERLHRQASLIYKYRENGQEERLLLGSELFYMLLELSNGYQLGDVSTDDSFAHLSIFVQRLVSEDERELFAWNPLQDEKIYKVFAEVGDDAGEKQRLVIKSITSGVQA